MTSEPPQRSFVTGNPTPLLEVEQLHVSFSRGRQERFVAVRGVTFDILPGETFALVGESGSGKTTVARTILGLLPPQSGQVSYLGTPLEDLSGAGYRQYRLNVQAVFQDPWSSLNPRHTVKTIILDPLQANQIGNEAEREQRVDELLGYVGLGSDSLPRYPHQLSGGQRQRVAIARALALEPRLVVLDEAISSLDVSTGAQVLNLLKDLQASLKLTYLFISHNLATVAVVADRIGVMHTGELVEVASTERLFAAIASDVGHPYTKALFQTSLDDTPISGAERRQPQETVQQQGSTQAGCVYVLACIHAEERCHQAKPAPIQLTDGRTVACHRIDETGQHADWQQTATPASTKGLPRLQRVGTPASTEPPAVLIVEHLDVDVSIGGRAIRAVDDVSFHIREGETLGLVGESGSGKSLTALSIVGVLAENVKIAAGRVLYRGVSLTDLSEEQMRSDIRGNEIGVILQDPMQSLNPLMRAGTQIEETLRWNTKLTRRQRKDEVVRLLEEVRIATPQIAAKMYPHELSGGMRQRIVGATAIAADPGLLIADEATSSLDATTEEQFLALLDSLETSRNLAMLFITHDLHLAARVCDRIAVMYGGRIVEVGPAESVVMRPVHPYTQGLVAAIPSEEKRGSRLDTIEGQPPPLQDRPTGCPFQPRCRYANSQCAVFPEWLTIDDGRRDVACWHVLDLRA